MVGNRPPGPGGPRNTPTHRQPVTLTASEPRRLSAKVAVGAVELGIDGFTGSSFGALGPAPSAASGHKNDFIPPSAPSLPPASRRSAVLRIILVKLRCLRSSHLDTCCVEIARQTKVGEAPEFTVSHLTPHPCPRYLLFWCHGMRCKPFVARNRWATHWRKLLAAVYTCRFLVARSSPREVRRKRQAAAYGVGMLGKAQSPDILG